jgi:hypothetical protein
MKQARSFKMNHQNRNPIANHPSSGNASDAGEDTLHLVAKLPPPAGLEDRIHSGLLAHARSAPRARRVLAWPVTASAASPWMRSAAAAAIVFVVAGGGWGIYSRVQQPQAAKVVVMPRGSAPGEFTNSGAMRTPTTLNGPVLVQPATVQPAQGKAPAKAAAKPTPPKTAKPAASAKTSTELAEPAAK